MEAIFLIGFIIYLLLYFIIKYYSTRVNIAHFEDFFIKSGYPVKLVSESYKQNRINGGNVTNGAGKSWNITDSATSWYRAYIVLDGRECTILKRSTEEYPDWYIKKYGYPEVPPTLCNLKKGNIINLLDIFHLNTNLNPAELKKTLNDANFVLLSPDEYREYTNSISPKLR